MARAFGLVAAFVWVVLVSQSLAEQAQQINVSGTWKVTISLPDGQASGYASLKQEGTKVTGRIGPAETDTMPIDGALSGNKLTLMTHPQPGRTAIFTKCELTVTADRLSGTIDTDKGKIEFAKTKDN